MSGEENKRIVRRWFEDGINKQDLSRIRDILSSDFVAHDRMSQPTSLDDYLKYSRASFAAFPDNAATIDDMIAEGDRVVARGFITGTHRGQFQGFAPTQRQFKVGFLEEFRVKDGKISDVWMQMDRLGMMQQLGVAPR